jgi:two-component system, cell cycle sensor histidine kinase and response regulator CckA
VITDLTMPAMTGLDFARQLQAIRPDLPIILTTGYNSTLTPERVRELGIREMLLKPLSMHSLAQALRRALNQPTARLTAAPTT